MRNLSYENEFCMKFHFHANQSHFHKNRFALRLALKQRHKGTRKWSNGIQHAAGTGVFVVFWLLLSFIERRNFVRLRLKAYIIVLYQETMRCLLVVFTNFQHKIIFF